MRIMLKYSSVYTEIGGFVDFARDVMNIAIIDDDAQVRTEVQQAFAIPFCPAAHIAAGRNLPGVPECRKIFWRSLSRECFR